MTSMNPSKTIHKVSLAIVKDKKILLVRSRGKEAFYNLGGKVEGTETDEECLTREVKEEINCDVDVSSLVYEASFEAPAHGKVNTLLKMKLYTGTVKGEPVTTSEIEKIGYFDSSIPERLGNPMLRLTLAYLKDKGLIG